MGFAFQTGLFQIVDLCSSWFWCLWALLGWSFFSWRSFHFNFGLTDLSWLPDSIPGFCKAASARCADWRLELFCTTTRAIQDYQEKLLLPRGVYDVGSWRRVLVTEQPMALLKLQLWGRERPHSCPGLYPCNQCWKGPVGPGLGDCGVFGAVEKLLVRSLDIALTRPLEALPSPSLRSASASTAALGCWDSSPLNRPPASLQSPPPFLTLHPNFCGLSCILSSRCVRLEPHIEHTEWFITECFITELFGLEGTFKVHPVQPPAVSGDTFNSIRFLSLTKAWFDPDLNQGEHRDKFIQMPAFCWYSLFPVHVSISAFEQKSSIYFLD